jgi:ABC-2 type transport system permease protein
MTLLYDVQSLFTRSLTKLWRNPTLLFLNLFQPLLFLLLFSQLLQQLGLFIGSSGSYLDYLTPGILVMNVALGMAGSGVSMVNDLNSGFLQKVLLTPANRAAILLGRLLSDLLVLMLQSVIIIGVAMLLGLSIATGILGFLLILVTFAFFGLAWSGFALAVGLKTKNTETLSALDNILTFPLIFISSALFPVAIMPLWAQTVAAYNPLSYVANVTRDLVLGGLTWSTFASAYAVIGLIAIVTLGATLYLFRKVVR